MEILEQLRHLKGEALTWLLLQIWSEGIAAQLQSRERNAATATLLPNGYTYMQQILLNEWNVAVLAEAKAHKWNE